MSSNLIPSAMKNPYKISWQDEMESAKAIGWREGYSVPIEVKCRKCGATEEIAVVDNNYIKAQCSHCMSYELDFRRVA